MQSLLSKRHLAAAQATPVQPQRRSAVLQHGRAFVRLPHQLPKSTPSGVCRAGPGADQSPGTPPDPWVAPTSYERTAAVGDTELQASAADQQEAAYNVPAYAPQYAQQVGCSQPTLCAAFEMYWCPGSLTVCTTDECCREHLVLSTTWQHPQRIQCPPMHRRPRQLAAAFLGGSGWVQVSSWPTLHAW